MTMPLLDRSTYYKGLLILMGRDRVIDPREREMLLRVGKMLDFDGRFCEAAIDDLLKNTHITGNPVLFSSRELAECFLCDAVRLAFVDEQMHRLELTWLRAVAQANGVADEWLDGEVRRLQAEGGPLNCARLAIRKYLA